MLEVREIEHCKLEVLYTAEPNKVVSKRLEAVNQLKREKVKVPGFRPGKASNDAIIQRFKSNINSWITQELVSEAYLDLQFEKNIKAVYQPQINSVSLNGDDFYCQMTVLKAPDFELGQYKEFQIPKPATQDLELQVAEAMERLRREHGENTPYTDDDVVQSSDKITMDLIAYVDGVRYEPLTKEGILHTVGDLPDVETEILGMKAGETRSFEHTIEDQKVRFDVTVHMGLKIKPMGLDDELAKKLGLNSFDELRNALIGAITNRNKTQERHDIHQQIVNNLLDENKFQCPEWLVDMSAQQLAAGQGAKWAELDSDNQKSFKEMGEKTVRLSFIFDKIRSVEPETVFSDEEVLNGLRGKALEMGRNPNEYLQELQNNGSLVGMVASLKDTLTLDWLATKSTIVE